MCEVREPDASIEVPYDWLALVAESPEKALKEQARIRAEFEAAFAAGLAGARFLA